MLEDAVPLTLPLLRVVCKELHENHRFRLRGLPATVSTLLNNWLARIKPAWVHHPIPVGDIVLEVPMLEYDLDEMERIRREVLTG